ncbi:uncharacterized protein LOC117105329 [Anneissia japonica]|uniref:uncharacterized protein LOC117105329 n=1 Tax=Anneissia japonica TaxID=1529436 RepID=UPI001425B209|nr:uncharacterized protein LOC117105329 [Anneissia japonica]
MATLMKMECYPYLICFALFASFTCTLQITCYNHDPLSINGTHPPSDLRCPEKCNCTYCANRERPILKYRHDVDCSRQELSKTPSKNTLPADVVFYFLKMNNIKSLKNNSFNTLDVLEHLYLDHNELDDTGIEMDAFSGLRKLRYLSMNNNPYFSKLRAAWFVDLVSLEILHLRFCEIDTLESDVFKHCKHLKEVDLSHNSILSFPSGVFQNLFALMYLYMSNNKIYELKNQAFVNSNRIQAISLHDNSLTTINENVGFQNLRQLQKLNVAFNSFLCDCNLVWFRKWINSTNVTVADIFHTECYRKPGRKMYIKLLHFDPDTLQCSKLIKILKITIPPVSALVVILIIGTLLYYFRYDLRYWNQRRRLRKQYEQINKQGPPPINGENIKYDAFVSYNSKDQPWIISVLQPKLEIDRNFKLCVDYRDFIAGEAVVDNIANAVKYSRKVLLVVSKNFIKSEWCYFELEMARMRMFDNHEDILVVVVLEKVSAKDMPILLHKILTTKTYIEWEEHPEGQVLFWAKLEAALVSPNCPRYRLLHNPLGLPEYICDTRFKATLMKMECYPYLICFALFASFTCTLQITCYNYDPLSINGTHPPNDLRCPEKCNCTYCANRGTPILKYRHNVDCSRQELSKIPSKNTLPADVVFYFLKTNNIKSLKNNSFNTLAVLEYLYLDHNELEDTGIEFDAFGGLRKLRYFSMNNNPYLSKLRAAWFVDLVSLELLHLQFCGINTLESDVFKHCKQLQKVDLSHNSIVSFPTSVFQNLFALMYLYMPNNKINELPNQAFIHSNCIQAIALRDNFLTTINENVGFQNLSELQTLNLSYNKFSCDCNLVWFRKWIDKTNVTIKDIGHTECFRKHGQSNMYIKLMDFKPDTLQCSKLITILRTTIPSVSALVVISIIGTLLYYFRYDLRYWNQRRRLRKQYEQINKQGPPPINGENIKYDAFVSYNSKDQHWIISVLQPKLEIDRNFKLCVDYRDFIAGEAIVDNIANAVKYSRKVLLVVSKNFIKSEWCYFELEMARMRMFDNHEDILVVVVLEKVSAKDMPILLHKILTTKTYIEWEEHPAGQVLFWAKLEAALVSPNCPRYRLLHNPCK